MFFFKMNKKQTKIFLVLSIESGHVRACFVSHSFNDKPYIVAEHIEKNREATIEQVKININKSLTSILQKYPCTIEKTFCFLGAAWNNSKSFNFSKDEETPFLFKEKDITNTLKNWVSDFTAEMSNLHPNEDLIPLEKNILHIALNGYEANISRRQHVRRVDFSAYISLVSKDFLEIVENEILKHFKKEIDFHSSLLAQMVVARDAFQYLDNFLIVHTDTNKTEINLISGGTTIFTSSFGVGTQALEDSAKELHLDKKAALYDLKLLAMNHQLQEGSSVYKVIQLAQEKWRSGFIKTLERAMSFSPVPENVIVVNSPVDFTWIQTAIEDSRNKHFSISNKNLHAILINAESLQSFVGSKISDPDLRLMIYSSFTSFKVRNK